MLVDEAVQADDLVLVRVRFVVVSLCVEHEHELGVVVDDRGRQAVATIGVVIGLLLGTGATAAVSATQAKTLQYKNMGCIGENGNITCGRLDRPHSYTMTVTKDGVGVLRPGGKIAFLALFTGQEKYVPKP